MHVRDASMQVPPYVEALAKCVGSFSNLLLKVAECITKSEGYIDDITAVVFKALRDLMAAVKVADVIAQADLPTALSIAAPNQKEADTATDTVAHFIALVNNFLKLWCPKLIDRAGITFRSALLADHTPTQFLQLESSATGPQRTSFFAKILKEYNPEHKSYLAAYQDIIAPLEGDEYRALASRSAQFAWASALESARRACALVGQAIAKIDDGSACAAAFQALKEASSAYEACEAAPSSQAKRSKLLCVNDAVTKSTMLQLPIDSLMGLWKGMEGAISELEPALQVWIDSAGEQDPAELWAAHGPVVHQAQDFDKNMFINVVDFVTNCCDTYHKELDGFLPPFETLCEAKDEAKLVSDVVHKAGNIAVPAMVKQHTVFAQAVVKLHEGQYWSAKHFNIFKKESLLAAARVTGEDLKRARVYLGVATACAALFVTLPSLKEGQDGKSLLESTKEKLNKQAITLPPFLSGRLHM